jgi:DNA-binding NarL/FixJ family response regulator
MSTMSWKRQLARALRGVSEAMTLSELAAAVLQPLLRATDSSGVLLYRFNEQGAPEGIAGNLVATIPDYFPELFSDDPVQRTLLGRPLTFPVLSTEGVSSEAFRRSASYHYFYRPNDVEHLLGLALLGRRYGEPGMTGILFTRSLREEAFSNEEPRVLASVHEVLGSVARRAERVVGLQRTSDTLEALVSYAFSSECVAVDGFGRIAWISEAAQTGLRASELAALAGVIHQWARHHVGGPVEANLVCADRQVHVCRLRTAANQWLTLGRVASRRDAGSARLTAAETAVLAALGDGLSNRQIAERLAVSVETIRTQVSHILHKLGVSNRAQAALVWHRRNRLPS